MGYEEAKTIHPYTGTSGFYASLTLDTASISKLKRICQILELPFNQEDEELHVTLMYSPVGIPSILELPKLPCTALSNQFEMFGEDKDTLVLTLNAPYLHEINKQLRDAGCIPTFPEYKPHITVCICDIPPSKSTLKLANLRLRHIEPFSFQFTALTIEDIKPKD